MTTALRRVLLDDRGAAIAEYSLILAGIVLSCGVALQLTGVSLNDAYQGVVANWASAAQAGR